MPPVNHTFVPVNDGPHCNSDLVTSRGSHGDGQHLMSRQRPSSAQQGTAYRQHSTMAQQAWTGQGPIQAPRHGHGLESISSALMLPTRSVLVQQSDQVALTPTAPVVPTFALSTTGTTCDRASGDPVTADATPELDDSPDDSSTTGEPVKPSRNLRKKLSQFFKKS